ncbi:MAG: hypothetical protein DKM24_03310 [Candidatus Melainabacteria bacterium]|nr:MAG: hypothetical protein DKM24_03310 [Candidatus Melainabacteria bacterium]
MKVADLHVHSNNSDGSDSVENLVKEIKKANLEIFALTDHDTIAGCIEITKYIPENIKFIPSIELTCQTGDIKCHILGFNCNPADEKLNALIQKGKELRRKKLETRLDYIKNVLHIDLTNDELNWLYSRKSVVKTHLANLLVKRKMAKTNVEAMQKYLDGIKTGNTRFSIEEAIDAIVTSGGIPVWAHPLGGEGEKHIAHEKFMPRLEKMIAYGIKGLECYYSRYTLEEVKFLINCANSNNLLISGGSDYHGTNKENIQLAKLNVDSTPIDAENLTVLKYLGIAL